MKRLATVTDIWFGMPRFKQFQQEKVIGLFGFIRLIGIYILVINYVRQNLLVTQVETKVLKLVFMVSRGNFLTLVPS